MTRQDCGKCHDGWICERHPDLPWPTICVQDQQCRAMLQRALTESSRAQ
jgi:hypothetical protein